MSFWTLLLASSVRQFRLSPPRYLPYKFSRMPKMRRSLVTGDYRWQGPLLMQWSHELQPPLILEEISVSYRVGKPSEPPDDSTPALPWPLLVKFATRRAKNRMMVERKKLRKRPTTRGGDSNSPAGSSQGPLLNRKKTPRGVMVKTIVDLTAM